MRLDTCTSDWVPMPSGQNVRMASLVAYRAATVQDAVPVLGSELGTSESGSESELCFHSTRHRTIRIDGRGAMLARDLWHMRRQRIFPPKAYTFSRPASSSYFARVLILHTTATPWLPLWHQRPWQPPLRLYTLSPARERHPSSGRSAALSLDLHGFCERSASQVWNMAYDLMRANLESSIPCAPQPG